ncbi:MAG: hypothetical protein M1371_10625 [Actinobacteria bacterium]|nr:hypothetical protein [Actinomycetota bacterium]
MTSRERLLIAIQHKEPDYVPCSPWDTHQFPSKVQNIPLEKLDGALGVKEYTWFWKPQLETNKHFGFDSIIISPLCIGGGEYIPYINHSRSRVNVKIIKDSESRYKTKIELKTKAGVLTEERISPIGSSDYCTSHIYKDVEKDFEKIKCIYPEPQEMNLNLHLDAQKEMGEQGLLMLGFDTPWTWWILKRGADGFYDPFDNPKMMDEFTEWYTNYIIRYVKYFDQFNPDIYWVHGVNDSFAGPKFLDKYVYSFIKRIRSETKTCFKHFFSGSMSSFLEKEVDAGVDIIEILEPPPLGDVDLKDAKKRVGKDIVLQGNLDPINVLERDTPKQIEEEVKRCIDAAAEGGGYIFSTADQITHITSYENVEAMAKAVKKYGRY